MNEALFLEGGVQIVPPQLAEPQVIYLDFDGEMTRYNGEILTVENVEVKASCLTVDRTEHIVRELNSMFSALNVRFVTTRPAETAYSTIFVGKTSAFDSYGHFAGLAETIDLSNLNPADNAFVMLDADTCDSMIIQTISHETQHVTGMLAHGGEDIAAYAEENILIIYPNEDYHNLLHDHIGGHSKIDTDILGLLPEYMIRFVPISWCPECASYPVKIINSTNFLLWADRNIQGVKLLDGGKMFVSSGGTASNIGIGANAAAEVFSGGIMRNVTVDGGGTLILRKDAIISGFMTLDGAVSADSGATVDFSVNLLTDPLTFLVNGLDALSTVNNFTCTVKQNQATGKYLLADSAGFSKTITLKDTTGTILGELSPGNTPLSYGDKYYSLYAQNSTLTLSVTDTAAAGEIPDDIYEWLAHEKAYENLSEHEIISKDGYYFKIDKVIHDKNTGFDWYGMLRVDRDGADLGEAVSVSRGTEPTSDVFADIFSDFETDGIGLTQFNANKNEISDWYHSLEETHSIDFTGHSLGGALAQRLANYIGGRNVITFCSPGSTDGSVSGRVVHYVNSGDLIVLAGYGYTSGEYRMAFSAPGLNDMLSSPYFAQMHREKNLASTYSITGTSADLASGNFNYLTVPNGSGDYLFNTAYAKAILGISLGNVDIANMFVTRSGIEYARTTIARILNISTSDLMHAKHRTWKTGAGGAIAVANRTAIVATGLGYFAERFVSTWGWKDTISIDNKNLASSNGDSADKTVRAVFLDDDDVPDLLFDFTDRKFLDINFIDLKDSQITFNNYQMVYSAKIEKQNGWVCLSIPILNNGWGTLKKIVTATGGTVNNANVYVSQDRVYLLDDPEETYQFYFEQDTSVSAARGSINFLQEAIYGDSSYLEIYVTDIDASANSGGANDSVRISVSGEQNSPGIEVTLEETAAEGIFAGKIAFAPNTNDYPTITVNDAESLTVSYRDADNGVGIAEIIEKKIAVRKNSVILSVDEYGLAEDYSPYSESVNWIEFHIYVADHAKPGSYKLADNALDYHNALLIYSEDSEEVRSLYLGEAITAGDRTFMLSLDADALVLTVSGRNRSIGDLNGDGRDDIVMTIDQSTHPADGATGAWLIQSDQTPAWGDLSQRNEGWEIFGMGVTVAGKTTNDVYVKSADNLIGAWVTDDTGHVSGWETVGQFDANTQIVGLGDFDGDGQTNLLLRHENGAVGCYFTGGEKAGWNYFQSLGDEWKLSAMGDFNGDGRDDLVLVHDAGFAGTWLTQENGTMAWTDLDTVSDGFAVIGAGDFNGDGTDDVLLRTGTYFGAWLVENGSAKAWFGLGDLGDVTVEQIADFDGDGTDDLRIRSAAGDIGSLLVRGEGDLEWHYYGSVGAEWRTSLAAI